MCKAEVPYSPDIMVLGKTVSLWGKFISIKLGRNAQRGYGNRVENVCVVQKPMHFTQKEAMRENKASRKELDKDNNGGTN